MKQFFLLVSALFIGFSAHASVVIGVGYQGAQTNCNIATGGRGTISNCSFNPNGTVVCSCDVNVQVPRGNTCSSVIGVGYQGAQSNCTIASNGRGTISNCSFNPNGTVVCACCY
jgi:hypothetical protein